jgi:manganese-dependent inorganic pyrophosphatase
MSVVYVSGHRNPDLDSIGSAIGYAELKGRLHPADRYVPVRLGPINAQTAWALKRAGVEAPMLLPHIRLRVLDVMQECSLTVSASDPVRDVGLAMAERRRDMVPVLDERGALAGIVTERELARMYIRESRGASTFAERPVTVAAINDVLGGEVVLDAPVPGPVTGRLWVVAGDVGSMADSIGAGDIAVVGDREDAQRQAIALGVAVLIISQGHVAAPEVRVAAEASGTAIVRSPLDSYVTGRMVQLAVPCSSVMDPEPLTVAGEDLAHDIAERVKDVDYRAAIAVDEEGVPIGIVTRSDLVNPAPRRVLLVDHAEQAQSVPGIEHADIVEILDHHHIGSIETRIPVKATFDPVGSTASLVVERFRREGREPRPPTAMMLLAAILSDTVILTSPTTTERDRGIVSYLEELLALDASGFGMEMFEASSQVAHLSAQELIGRDTKEYVTASGRRVCIAQVELVGGALLERRPELLDALELARAAADADVYALMVTDVVGRGTELLVAGDLAAVERVFEREARDGAIGLPGVMSRKKQVAPPLLAL